MQTTAGFTAQQISDMRDWLADCTWADMDDRDIAKLDAATVIAGINAHYQGGTDQFITDGGPDQIAADPATAGIAVEIRTDDTVWAAANGKPGRDGRTVVTVPAVERVTFAGRDMVRFDLGPNAPADHPRTALYPATYVVSGQ